MKNVFNSFLFSLNKFSQLPTASTPSFFLHKSFQERPRRQRWSQCRPQAEGKAAWREKLFSNNKSFCSPRGTITTWDPVSGVKAASKLLLFIMPLLAPEKRPWSRCLCLFISLRRYWLRGHLYSQEGGLIMSVSEASRSGLSGDRGVRCLCHGGLFTY